MARSEVASSRKVDSRRIDPESPPSRQITHDLTVPPSLASVAAAALGFLVRRTFDAACRLAGLHPKILIESRAPSNLLALAEAGHGVAVIPSVVLTHRHALRIVRISHDGKPLREPLGIVWDKRRVLPRYARDFSEKCLPTTCAIFSR